MRGQKRFHAKLSFLFLFFPRFSFLEKLWFELWAKDVGARFDSCRSIRKRNKVLQKPRCCEIFNEDSLRVFPWITMHLKADLLVLRRYMKTSDFDYVLPPELIAQAPAPVRDKCRLLVMERTSGALKDCIFSDIEEYLCPGDLLIANETRVLPARLLGKKRGTGGAAEVFLLRESAGNEPRTNKVAFWEALVRPGKRLKPGTGAIIDFVDAHNKVVMSAEVIDWAKQAESATHDAAPSASATAHGTTAGASDTAATTSDAAAGAQGQRGERIVRLSTELSSLDEALHAVGKTPLPPYIKDYTGDAEMYQTVYSRRESSAAAPTAGLHFTPELIERLKNKGVFWETVELEVGLDTFRIVDEDDPTKHHMHTEFYTVSKRVIEAIKKARACGGRVVAVGTTSVRSLESAWDASAPANGTARPSEASKHGAVIPRERAATSLYLLPGSHFNVVDALITNFHVPKSTLMMLVSAFSSRDTIMAAYEHAIKERYRMLSFGDAMFIY